MSEENTTVETVTEPLTPTKPLQDTFSREYVEALRGESKGTRLELKAARDEAKSYASKLKSLIGLKPEDEIDDAKITAYQAKLLQDNANAISKVNERLIQAEIKGIEGYDTKLVLKLLDKSEVKIADDGTITGITEALAKLETEFPQIKINTPGSPANPANHTLTEIQKLEEEYNAALKAGNVALSVALKNKLFGMRK